MDGLEKSNVNLQNQTGAEKQKKLDTRDQANELTVNRIHGHWPKIPSGFVESLIKTSSFTTSSFWSHHLTHKATPRLVTKINKACRLEIFTGKNGY